MEEVGVSRSTGASAMGQVCRGMVRANKFGVCWLWIQKGMESEICTNYNVDIHVAPLTESWAGPGNEANVDALYCM